MRRTGPRDQDLAPLVAALIREASIEHDIALRAEELLEFKIRTGRAVMAFHDEDLVGFAYFSEWEEGRFISHSGLVVRADMRGAGLGRALKMALFEASRARFPDAVVMSLSSSEEVIALNRSLGFKPVPFEKMTRDEGFWKGCESCRNWPETHAAGERCCCQGMILEPGRLPPQEGRA